MRTSARINVSHGELGLCDQQVWVDFFRSFWFLAACVFLDNIWLELHSSCPSMKAENVITELNTKPVPKEICQWHMCGDLWAYVGLSNLKYHRLRAYCLPLVDNGLIRALYQTRLCGDHMYCMLTGPLLDPDIMGITLQKSAKNA